MGEEQKNISKNNYFVEQNSRLIKFITLFGGILLIPAGIIFIVQDNLNSGIVTLVVSLFAWISFFFARKKKPQFGSILLIIAVQAMVFYIAISRFDNPNYAPHFLSVISGMYVTIIFSSVFFGRIGTIIAASLNLTAMIIILLLYGDPLMIQRFPIIILTMMIIGSMLLYFSKTQRDLLDRVLKESKNNESILEELKSVINKVQETKRETNETQDIIYNNLTDIETIMNTYSTKINELASSSQESKTDLDNSYTDLQSLTNSIEVITDKIESQSSFINQNASSQEEIYSSIKSIRDNIKIADKINHSLSSKAEKGRDSIDSIKENINKLSQFQSQMVEIIKTISNISEQTNMLSMNASIEAAHAGESGKGFGVVAEEIRKLADDSSNNTKKISGIIKNMNNYITTSVNATQQVSDNLLNIIDDIKQVYPIINEISSAMDQQMKTNKEVIEGIRELINITDTIKAQSTEEKKIANNYSNTFSHLSQYIEELNNTISELNNYNEKSQFIFSNISIIKNKNEQLDSNLEKLIKDVI
ncbi:MAG: methyl-accepting chemotaxis protein [Spirochaetota bacterium]